MAAECARPRGHDASSTPRCATRRAEHLRAALSLDDVMRAWLRGFDEGMAASEAAGRPISAIRATSSPRCAVCALRGDIAELSVRYRDEGVVGFDIAGPEQGLSPSRHLDAFQLIHRANFHVTIHAGEAFGLLSIWEALQWCGAERLGPWRAHRRRHHRRAGRPHRDGPPWAQYVRDRRVPSRWRAPTSNVHTGAVATFADHPIDLLRRLRFRVTVNTDNRLMSGVSLSDEFVALNQPSAWGWTRCSG
ncbi:MAG: hypothetical protein U0869_02110 [Chloroflexota bacterium]